jgi:replicative DNA helicase
MAGGKTRMTFSIEKWQRTADYILPVLVAEQMDTSKNVHFWRTNEMQVLAMHFPPGCWRETFKAVGKLVFENKAIHPTTLQELLHGIVDPQQLAQWFVMYKQGSTLANGVFDTNLEALRDMGERVYAIERLQSAQDKLLKGMDIDDVKSDAISGLINSGTDSIEDETLDEMANWFDGYMSEQPTNHILTGIEIIDSWTFGLSHGDLFVIAAPMKQRKTSLALNMVINMARRGHSCALLMIESNKKMVYMQMITMLAMEYLIKTKAYGKLIDDPTNTPVERFSAKMLAHLQANYAKWGETRHQAIQYAQAEARKIAENLRIYDKTRKGGSLRDMASIHRVILRDKALHRTEVAIIDHAQRIKEPGKDYDKLSIIAPFIEDLARVENICIGMLAQMNMGAMEGSTEHNAGVRGGTALEESADYTFITGYRQKIPGMNGNRYGADKLIVGLHESRYGDGGVHKRALVSIDPSSGYILYGGRGELIDMTGSEDE